MKLKKVISLGGLAMTLSLGSLGSALASTPASDASGAQEVKGSDKSCGSKKDEKEKKEEKDKKKGGDKGGEKSCGQGSCG